MVHPEQVGESKQNAGRLHRLQSVRITDHVQNTHRNTTVQIQTHHKKSSRPKTHVQNVPRIKGKSIHILNTRVVGLAGLTILVRQSFSSFLVLFLFVLFFCQFTTSRKRKCGANVLRARDDEIESPDKIVPDIS